MFHATITAGDTWPLHSALTYTLLDIAGSLWGTLVFATALLAPGYLIASQLNIAGFRDKSAAEQAAWSVILSVGLGTIFIVAVTWLAGVTTAAAVLALMALAAIGVWTRSSKQRANIPWRHTLLFTAWSLLVIVSLVDIGSGSRLWMSVTAYDHSVRTAFVDAVMRTGVVPVNPLYWPGHDAPLRYYYFWYVTCGVVAKLAHISARQAFIASCVWPAAAVVAMLALYGKYLLGWTGAELRSRTRLGTVLLAVTGLDALVTLFNWLAGGATPGDMEWWSIDQVTSWLDTFLWVPHHAAALVCCLLCFLLLWMARTEPRIRQRVLLAIIAGLSFASAFGLSTYVAIGFSLIMLAWLVRSLFVRTQSENASARNLLTATVIASFFAAATLTPYIAQLLRHSDAEPHPTQRVIIPEVRQMLDPSMLANVPGLARLGVHHPFALTQVSAVILLLPGYFVELGFFAVAIILALRIPRKTEGERALIFLFFAGIISVSFLRSTVIATNDYGVRASLLAQFFILPLAVRALETSGRWSRRALIALAVIGVFGSVYQALSLRIFLPCQQAHSNPAMHNLAERNYALRDAFTLFAQRAPSSARLQYDTSAGGYFDYAYMLNAQHQIVTAGATCNTGFGGEQEPCQAILQTVQTLFPLSGHTVPSSARAGELCSRSGIQYLVVTRWDAAWSDRSGWPWSLPPVVTTPDVRIVRCPS